MDFGSKLWPGRWDEALRGQGDNHRVTNQTKLSRQSVSWSLISGDQKIISVKKNNPNPNETKSMKIVFPLSYFDKIIKHFV